MRRVISAIGAAALAVAPAGAYAQTTERTVPEPAPIITTLDRTPMVELWDGGGGLPYVGSPSSYDAGDWENTLRHYHDSGVYRRQVAKVDRVAAAWLRQARRVGGSFRLRATWRYRGALKAVLANGRGRHRRDAHRARRRLAIVFDIDETALSNYSAIEADNFTFGTNSQNQAQNKVGVAIDPSLALFRLAKRKRIARFFISGRRENVRTPTAENLAEQGFAGYKRLILMPQAFTGTTVDFKADAREDLEERGYRIVANVGDQYSDLAGGHAQIAFKLPNPFYFVP